MRRSDNDSAAASRSPRMYQQDDSWFFNTREGTAAGPFKDKLEASTQLEVYIRMADSGLLPPRS
ncbi:MAG: DUF6316 family protein [Halioglobus sp.]|nr:DUF6316 family protein [Halioglobus sp.]